MEDQFILVTSKGKDGSKKITEFKEGDGKFVIKQYAGLNTDVFSIKKSNGKSLTFSFFKINGTYYISLNEQHICDYRKFTFIDQIKQDNEHVIIKNSIFGEIKLKNCEVDIVQKALTVMNEFIKPKRNIIKDFFEFILL